MLLTLIIKSKELSLPAQAEKSKQEHQRDGRNMYGWPDQPAGAFFKRKNELRNIKKSSEGDGDRLWRMREFLLSEEKNSSFGQIKNVGTSESVNNREISPEKIQRV